ncbi:MAG: murein biosynthesis integral membrane protein MurJ [Candidatus Azotimanducaceae bacterium WSBS_2022_MAG_OTU7]
MEQPNNALTGKLLRSSFVVSVMTMLSRIFGLTRDMVIAYFFGAAAGADAFFLAFRIPNFFRRLFAEGAFSQAFVPVLTDYKEHRSREEVRVLIGKSAGSLGVILVLLTIAGVLGAAAVIGLFAPGFVYHGDTAKFDLAVDMLRLTFPYLFLISMTALSGAVLNTFDKFAVPAFTPVLLNVSLIASAILLRPYFDVPVMALAWGVLIAGVAQLTFQLPFLARENLLPLPSVDFKDPGVKRIAWLMLPAVFGASVGQINLLVDTLLASFLETGSLSWLYYSDRLLELPLALFGITIATVILPSLSREHTTQSGDAFSGTLNWALRLVLFFGLPATITLVYLAEPLVAALFYQGELTVRDVAMSSYSLAAYGVGLLGHMMVKVLAPGYFARQDTRTPVRYGIFALVANIVLNFALVWQFNHVGLAMATSLSAFLNAGLLLLGLLRADVLRLSPGWMLFLLQISFSSLVMLLVLYLVLPEMSFWISEGFVLRIVTIVLICLAGAVSYAAALLCTGFRYQQLVH